MPIKIEQNVLHNLAAIHLLDKQGDWLYLVNYNEYCQFTEYGSCAIWRMFQIRATKAVLKPPQILKHCSDS